MRIIDTIIADGVLAVHLNRPEVHNALNLEMVTGLTNIFKDAAKDKDLRLITLRGNGASFCAGGDVNWMRGALDATAAQQRRDSQHLADMYEAIFQCPLPVMAVVHGNIMGGGVGLVATCDIVSAEKTSRFALTEVKLGIIPSVISPYLLSKASAAHLLPLMLTAENFGVDRAFTLGFVHHAGTLDECETFAQSTQKALLNNSPAALTQLKKLIRRLPHTAWASKRRLTIDLNAKVRASHEGQEGMRAFLEKRLPSWRKE